MYVWANFSCFFLIFRYVNIYVLCITKVPTIPGIVQSYPQGYGQGYCGSQWLFVVNGPWSMVALAAAW